MVEQTLQTIENIKLGLSNNIMGMADCILVMAGKIGKMSGRIVYTEELMQSSQKKDYLLFFSNNADMSAATNALVENNDTSITWSRVADFATANKLYIAVKTVGGATSSDCLNTVMLNLQ